MSAYAGRCLTGVVRQTWLRGERVALDGEPHGRLLRRGHDDTSYYAPTGGLPGQTELTTDRAVFTEAYAVLPRGTMRDIVTSYLPFWDDTRLWVIARPLSGFAETFSQYIVEVGSGGGSERPEADPVAEAVLFVVDGELQLTIDERGARARPGGYAYLPPGAAWTLRNRQDDPARFHWIRKAYQRVDGHRDSGAVRDERARRERRSRCPTPTVRGPRRASSTRPTCATTCTSTSSTSTRAARSRSRRRT